MTFLWGFLGGAFLVNLIWLVLNYRSYQRQFSQQPWTPPKEPEPKSKTANMHDEDYKPDLGKLRAEQRRRYGL